MVMGYSGRCSTENRFIYSRISIPPRWSKPKQSLHFMSEFQFRSTHGACVRDIKDCVLEMQRMSRCWHKNR